MQKQFTPIGKCEEGHEVFVTHDLNGEVDGATIGANVLTPLPDGVSEEPIVMACEACTALVRRRLPSRT